MKQDGSAAMPAVPTTILRSEKLEERKIERKMNDKNNGYLLYFETSRARANYLNSKNTFCRYLSVDVIVESALVNLTCRVPKRK